MHWVSRGTGTPKDRDEVFKREDCECDGWVCDFEVIGTPLEDLDFCKSRIYKKKEEKQKSFRE